MGYNWTTLSATRGAKITAANLQNAINQANDMYNTHASGNSSVHSSYNSGYNGTNNADWYDPPNCSTHYSAFARKCGGQTINSIQILKLIERIRQNENRTDC